MTLELLMTWERLPACASLVEPLDQARASTSLIEALQAPLCTPGQPGVILYKRYIDDILLIWSGSFAELCSFSARFATANTNIKLEWQNSPEAVDSPAIFDQHQHRSVNFLDLDIQIIYSQGSAEFAFKVYSKPGSAFVYLPYGSYHARHVFRGWLKVELHRLLTHCVAL